MRTTLTLDPDVAAKAKQSAARRNKSFKEIINEALRIGLNETLKTKSVQPYQTKGKPLGLKKGLSYDNIGELIALSEGENYK